MAERTDGTPKILQKTLVQQNGILTTAPQVSTDTADGRGSNVRSYLSSLNTAIHNAGSAVSSALAPLSPIVGKITSFFSVTNPNGTAPGTYHSASGIGDWLDRNGSTYIKSSDSVTRSGDSYTGIRDSAYSVWGLQSSTVSANTVLAEASYVAHTGTVTRFDFIRRTAANLIQVNDYTPAIPATQSHDIEHRVNFSYPSGQTFHGLTESNTSFDVVWPDLSSASIRPGSDIRAVFPFEQTNGLGDTSPSTVTLEFPQSELDDTTHLPPNQDWTDEATILFGGEDRFVIQYRVYEVSSQKRIGLRIKPNTFQGTSAYEYRIMGGRTPAVFYYEHSDNAVAAADNWVTLQTAVGVNYVAPADDNIAFEVHPFDPHNEAGHSSMVAESLNTSGNPVGFDVIDFTHIRLNVTSIEFSNTTEYSFATNNFASHQNHNRLADRLNHFDSTDSLVMGLVSIVPGSDEIQVNADVDIIGSHKLKFNGTDFDPTATGGGGVGTIEGEAFFAFTNSSNTSTYTKGGNHNMVSGRSVQTEWLNTLMSIEFGPAGTGATQWNATHTEATLGIPDALGDVGDRIVIYRRSATSSSYAINKNIPVRVEWARNSDNTAYLHSKEMNAGDTLVFEKQQLTDTTEFWARVSDNGSFNPDTAVATTAADGDQVAFFDVSDTYQDRGGVDTARTAARPKLITISNLRSEMNNPLAEQWEYVNNTTSITIPDTAPNNKVWGLNRRGSGTAVINLPDCSQVGAGWRGTFTKLNGSGIDIVLRPHLLTNPVSTTRRQIIAGFGSGSGSTATGLDFPLKGQNSRITLFSDGNQNWIYDGMTLEQSSDTIALSSSRSLTSDEVGGWYTITPASAGLTFTLPPGLGLVGMTVTLYNSSTTNTLTVAGGINYTLATGEVRTFRKVGDATTGSSVLSVSSDWRPV